MCESYLPTALCLYRKKPFAVKVFVLLQQSRAISPCGCSYDTLLNVDAPIMGAPTKANFEAATGLHHFATARKRDWLSCSFWSKTALNLVDPLEDCEISKDTCLLGVLLFVLFNEDEAGNEVLSFRLSALLFFCCSFTIEE